ncbi:MAG: hypothetical protein KA956_00775 [Pyrinomonadaceae bacterium]|nr:hypothetical protein [Acidobacteriota bacterium]MBK7932801.1 hypothetical protein [Acidobacteriota bacterium]MBP7374986.1 hypothetical protein [Pyrinomonadaceae bacterium]
MRIVKNAFSLSLLALSLVLASATFADAQKRNDKDIRDTVRSLSSNLDNFEYDLRYQMQSSSANNTDISDVSDDIRNLKDAISQFQRNFDQKRENRDDVDQIIASARAIDDFLRGNPQNRRVEDDWNTVKKQLDRLAANYGTTPNWDNEDFPQGVIDQPDTPIKNNTFSVGLSGTYNLDMAQSESIDDVVSNANLSSDNRQDLKDKLEAPGQIAIEIRGTQVTLATSKASPVTFSADGRDKVEQGPNGKNIRLRAILNGQTLTISSLGGETDYTITFTSASSGQVLKVSRRITTDYLDQTVFAESVYNKTDNVARLGIENSNNSNGGYSDNDQTGSGTYGNPPTTSTGRIGEFVVPNGTVLTGILENEINTKVSQNNDRFRLTVQSPNEFRGAVIDGYVTGVGRSGKVTGRSNVTFNFEKITLRDGKSYDFGGNLQSIKDTNGKPVKIDTEGTAKGGSQTKESVKRGGLGAGLGALIGAIAGGAKGAVIGAVIGGGAGAGSVAIQGRDDLQLQKGSTMTIQSSSPIRGNSQDR